MTSKAVLHVEGIVLHEIIYGGKIRQSIYQMDKMYQDSKWQIPMNPSSICSLLAL
jgi:hypothetical protein